MKEIICIGHITLDRVVTPLHVVDMPGGTAYYFSHAMSRLNHGGHYHLITALAPSEKHVVDEIRAKGIDVSMITSAKSVNFENVYGNNPDERTQRVIAKAIPFTQDNVKVVRADYIHLGSLLADDFSVDLMRHLATIGHLSVDAQGFLREVRGQHVYAVDWKDKREVLPCIDILKVNECEMEALTGLTSPHDAALRLSSWGVKEVVITLGSKGSLVYFQTNFYAIPAFPPSELVDSTGCGDTYMAGYLYKRAMGYSCLEAGIFAAAMSTLKLEHLGPFDGSEADVELLIAQHAHSRSEETEGNKADD